MNYIRLKTNIYEESIQNRLKYNPELIELHLNEEDLEDLVFLVHRIRQLKKLGIEVYLHHPMKKGERKLDILDIDPEMKKYYDWSTKVLAEICDKEKVHCVIHGNYEKTKSSFISLENSRKVRDRIKELVSLPGGDRLLWENSIEGVFSNKNPDLFKEIIEPLNLNIVVDISHSFISLKGDNDKLKMVLDQAKPYVKYFHVVDSIGVDHDGLELGKGKVDWKMVIPYIKDKPFVFEIGLPAPYTDCSPMIRSGEYFRNLLKQPQEV